MRVTDGNRLGLGEPERVDPTTSTIKKIKKTLVKVSEKFKKIRKSSKKVQKKIRKKLLRVEVNIIHYQKLQTLTYESLPSPP